MRGPLQIHAIHLDQSAGVEFKLRSLCARMVGTPLIDASGLRVTCRHCLKQMGLRNGLQARAKSQTAVP
jgi:hypothetical protein